jgi:hypothetical protein
MLHPTEYLSSRQTAKQAQNKNETGKARPILTRGRRSIGFFEGREKVVIKKVKEKNSEEINVVPVVNREIMVVVQEEKGIKKNPAL